MYGIKYIQIIYIYVYNIEALTGEPLSTEFQVICHHPWPYGKTRNMDLVNVSTA